MKTKQDFPSINERPPEGIKDDGTKVRVLIVDDSIFVAKQLGHFRDRHTVIYGHHVKDKTMFSRLMRYKKQSFYDEHTEILLVTPDAYYSLRAFSGYVADSRTNAWDLDMTEHEDPAQSRRYCVQYLLLFHVSRRAFWKNCQVKDETDLLF